MKFCRAAAAVTEPGDTTCPKLHGRFSQPDVEAAYEPVVDSVGFRLRLTAPASRAGLVVTSDQVPDGSVWTSELLDTEPGFPEPKPYVNGPDVESVTFATDVL
jgi:hypothetical protein